MSSLNELKLVDQEEIERRRLAEKMGYLTEDQVASLARVKVSTVDDWRRRGKGPDYIPFGSAYFYEIQDVLDYIKSLKKIRSREAIIRSI